MVREPMVPFNKTWIYTDNHGYWPWLKSMDNLLSPWSRPCFQSASSLAMMPFSKHGCPWASKDNDHGYKSMDNPVKSMD